MFRYQQAKPTFPNVFGEEINSCLSPASPPDRTTQMRQVWMDGCISSESLLLSRDSMLGVRFPAIKSNLKQSAEIHPIIIR